MGLRDYLRTSILGLSLLYNPLNSSAVSEYNTDVKIEKQEKLTFLAPLGTFTPSYKYSDDNERLAWEGILGNGIDDLVDKEIDTISNNDADNKKFKIKRLTLDTQKGYFYLTSKMENKDYSINGGKIVKREFIQVLLEAEKPIKTSELSTIGPTNGDITLNHSVYSRFVIYLRDQKSKEKASIKIDNYENSKHDLSCQIDLDQEKGFNNLIVKYSGNTDYKRCLKITNLLLTRESEETDELNISLNLLKQINNFKDFSKNYDQHQQKALTQIKDDWVDWAKDNEIISPNQEE